ncbi:DUF763 domain-containing protein [Legionella septentrionalis]|uniref:DUF763 domain-containing protein n=1 Tax=Legionella septentrionalis TaxID=2498109 RepID=A0A3S0VBE3_9GAMM|nr:DUF763 domain-containing protein [Legionella septentrionalis]RUQ89740.1 DUF763 domain-containing protein [Legionella septentrionalis]RUR11091.1 DUF763 domain-containing protein [Legionella septentrionalis]
MAQKTGLANLPLHYGRVPSWLAERMTKLGTIISRAIIYHYGRDEFLRRLANPFWFQSFGAVMGMDWHSSGITTSVIGALKRGLTPLSRELGIHVCGGRGKYSRQTPQELVAIGCKTGFDGAQLAQYSRLVAKVDSAAVQDGFALYLHGFIVTDEGKWTVIQQGMNAANQQARRYHWLSEGLQSFVDAPHAAIEGHHQGNIINLTDQRAQLSRTAQIELLKTFSPERILAEIAQGGQPHSKQITVTAEQLSFPCLAMPKHHEVRAEDISLRRLHGNIAAAIDRGPQDFSELLLTPKVGARTVLALAMVAEIMHGAPYRFSDPARFSIAHGGKDRHPFPVPTKVYDETIRVLKAALETAKLGQSEKLDAIKRLDKQARALERHIISGPSVDEILAHEKDVSSQYGGRSIFGFE